MASVASSAPDQRHIRLLAAAAQANETKVREILAEQPSWDSSNDRDSLRQSLQKVSARGNLAVVRLLLQHGAEVNTRRENEIPALVKAAEGGHVAVVSELLGRKADPDARKLSGGNTALFSACARGHNKVVKVLLDGGASLELRDIVGRTVLLFLASEKGSGRWTVETLKLLLDKGADLEARDSTGRTPLLWGATNGNIRLVDALLSGELGKTADLSAANNRGRTALHLAAENNGEEMVKLLLSRGADVAAMSDGGWTALHNAAQNGCVGVVSLLLGAEANVNAELSNGMTPLHWAAFQGHEDVVKLLLKRPDADLTIKDGFDRTAMLCAAEKKHKEIVKLLSPDRAGDRLSPIAKRACKEFEATVIDFGNFRDGKKQLVFKHSVYDVLYGWEVDEKTKVEKPKVATMTKNVKYEPAFRWIHLPANNIAWVETLLAKNFVESGHRDIEAFKALERCFDQEHRGPLPHAHFMRTFCNRISPPQDAAASEKEDSKPLVSLTEEVPDITFTSPQLAGGEASTGASTPRKPTEQAENGTPKPESAKKKGKSEQIAERHPKRPKRASGPPGNPPGTKAAKLLSRQSTQMSWDGSKLPSSNGKLVIFMPFLHYETDKRRQEMSLTIKNARNGRPLPENPSRDVLLINAYLKKTPPLHPRRTLDQFFYHGIDTSIRDVDQVVYRYCARHHIERRVFMVDSLWLWVLGRDLVITCFPQRWEQPKRDPLNVLDGVIEETNAKTRPPIQSVYDLAMLIVSRCSGMFDRHRLDASDLQFLDMFESSIGLVTNKESQLFERFNQASIKSTEFLHQTRLRGSRASSASSGLDDTNDDLLEIGTETRLLAEIKDIQDELNIIGVILSNQLSILEDFESNVVDDLRNDGSRRATDSIIWEIRKRSREQKRLLETHRKDIDRMDRQVASIYVSLTHLLDLKQKHSNALEARYAREHAVLAARQGQTLMLFTIVTVLLLPMSFIAAFFAINIKDWNGNELTLGFVSRYTFGIGLGVSIPLIIMAFMAPDILSSVDALVSSLKRLARRRRDESAKPRSDEADADVQPPRSAASQMEERKKWGFDGTSPRLRPSYDPDHGPGYSGLSPNSITRRGSDRQFSIGSAWGRPSFERARSGISEDLERGRAGGSSSRY